MRLPARSWTDSAVPGRAANRNVEAAKPSGRIVSAGARRVEQEVLAGDADVEAAGSDIDRDVAGAQVEELGLVLGVDEDELARIVALQVARLAQHLHGGLGQRSLVGHCDAK